MIEKFKEIGVDLNAMFRESKPNTEVDMTVCVEVEHGDIDDFDKYMELNPAAVGISFNGKDWIYKQPDSKEMYQFAYVIPKETVAEWYENRPRIAL
jgi:hypothetical protein